MIFRFAILILFLPTIALFSADDVLVENSDSNLTINDSLLVKLSILEEKVESMEIDLIKYKAVKDFISNEITIYTAIVSILVIFFTIIFNFLIPKGLEKTVDQKLAFFKKELNKDLEAIKQNYDKAYIRIIDTDIRSTRSLYESSPVKSLWRFIWSIRFINAIHDKHELFPDDPNLLRDFKIRMNAALKEIKELEHPEHLKGFENIGGIKGTLRNLLNVDDSEIQNLALSILNEIQLILGTKNLI